MKRQKPMWMLVVSACGEVFERALEDVKADHASAQAVGILYSRSRGGGE